MIFTEPYPTICDPPECYEEQESTMLDDATKSVLEQVRNQTQSLVKGLSSSQYKDFLDERIADLEGALDALKEELEDE